MGFSRIRLLIQICGFIASTTVLLLQAPSEFERIRLEATYYLSFSGREFTRTRSGSEEAVNFGRKIYTKRQIDRPGGTSNVNLTLVLEASQVLTGEWVIPYKVDKTGVFGSGQLAHSESVTEYADSVESQFELPAKDKDAIRESYISKRQKIYSNLMLLLAIVGLFWLVVPYLISRVMSWVFRGFLKKA